MVRYEHSYEHFFNGLYLSSTVVLNWWPMVTFRVVYGISTVIVNKLEFQYSVREKLFSWQNFR